MSLFQRLQTALGMGLPFEEVSHASELESGWPNPYLGEAPVAVFRTTGLPTSGLPTNGLSTNVVDLPGVPLGHSEMVLMTPRSFSEMPNAVMALRERKSVILNLTFLTAEQAQRCADYVAGGVCAIDGHQERLGERVLLFTPSSIQINNFAIQNSVEPPPQIVHRPIKPEPSWTLNSIDPMTDSQLGSFPKTAN